jgi:hypothetical protein
VTDRHSRRRIITRTRAADRGGSASDCDHPTKDANWVICAPDLGKVRRSSPMVGRGYLGQLTYSRTGGVVDTGAKRR